MASKSILILGAGSWGTALGLVLSRRGVRTYLWDSDAAHIERLSRQRTNDRHLPGFAFPDPLIPVVDINGLSGEVADVVIAVPCEGLRSALQRLQTLNDFQPRICLASKGLEPGTWALNHEVVLECLGPLPLAVLSGPSFAREVAAGLPTAVTIASESDEDAAHFADLFHCDVFRIYTHGDVIGVQVSGAVKNVMAIAAGIADGLGFGANTRAALITRGLTEITRLGVAMGGKSETFIGLAGLGDLVLTCTDDQSRNRRLGLALAAGRSLHQAKADIGQAIEGLRTAGVVCQLADRLNVEMPISEQVQSVITGVKAPRDAVQELLVRERKMESQF